MSALGRKRARHARHGLLPAMTASVLLLVAPHTRADEPAAPADPNAPTTAAQVNLTKDTKGKTAEDVNAAPPETPPATPYKKTVVLDSTVGAIGFLGEFGKSRRRGRGCTSRSATSFSSGSCSTVKASSRSPTHPTGRHRRTRERSRCTDSVVARASPFASPIGSVSMLKVASVCWEPTSRRGSLGLLGFHDAESLGLYLGARLGLEWYQLDRHLALGLNAGIRTAQGFARLAAGTDTPLALDGGVSLRYAF